MNIDNFNRKVTKLGITHSNQKKRLDELFKVRIDNSIKNVAMDWCDKNMGDKWIYGAPVNCTYTDIWFVDKEDAVIFKLTFTTI